MEINELFGLGCNKYGQLGAGKKYHNETFDIPKTIIYPIFIKQVVCGVNHSAILTLEGNIYAMGSNMHGTLARPTSNLNYSYSPVLVTNLREVSKICSGAYHLCAISNNTLYSWGKGLDGQLGTSTFTNSHVPTKIQSFFNEVEEVSCGSNHTLVKTLNKNCYSFGNGIYGQLGVGSNKNFSAPVLVKLSEVDQVCAGQNYSLFLKNGCVYGAGDNSKGQVSNTLKKKCLLQPVKTDMTDILTLRAGKFSAAISQSQQLYLWGPYKNEFIDIKIKPESQIIEIKTGCESVFFSTSDGKFSEIRFFEGKPVFHEFQINTETILDFAVGERHCLVLGDIVGEIDEQIAPSDVLLTIQELQNKAEESSMLSLKIPNSLQSSNRSQSSIRSEHFSRTPSSIMKQPTNFLKEDRPKYSNIEQFNQERKIEQKKEVGVRREDSKDSNLDEFINKIDELMNVLDKSSKIQENSSNIEISRKTTKRNLENSQIQFNKQNLFRQTSSRLTNKAQSQKTNKQLVMELREKQLKISQLQEKLSRKDVEIECQKKMIEMLKKVYKQNPNSSSLPPKYK